MDSSTIDYQPLDPEVIFLWQISSAISTVVLLAIAMAGGGFFAFQFQFGWQWVAVACLLLLIWRTIWVFTYPPRAYREWGYRIDQRVLELRHGVWFKELELLPLARLQHVDLHRGPVERWLGLASLVLYTAGTHNASLTIPGLPAAVALQLRDRLVEIGAKNAS